jgi:precorrin-8X/cobalt-precorrin-8 methylmutase
VNGWSKGQLYEEGTVMTTEYMTDPQSIERRSMEIIAPYLAPLQLTAAQTKVYERIIHSAGDPEYAKQIILHPQAIEAGISALRQGANIFTDVQMVRVGINARKLAAWGGTTHCLIADEAVAAEAKRLGITRSMVAMRKFGKMLEGQIVAIGNAPTALFELLKLMEEEGIRPALIVGVPVGFVGAAESKAALVERSPVPYITVRGHKGGSTVAVSVCNALLYMGG